MEVIVPVFLAVESGIVPRLYALYPVRAGFPHRHDDTETINYFSTIGRISGPAHYDVSIWQAAIEAFLASSLKIF